MIMENPKRLAYFLPNIFTCLNMACGFTAIMHSLHGFYEDASLYLLLGAVFDSVDGRVARLTGTQSSFGEQFDSLSDLLSFGVAPAFLYYLRFLEGFGKVGMTVTFLFILCGAMRLARFNANIDRISVDYFQGVPIPLGALALVGMTFLSVEFPIIGTNEGFTIAYILTYALLMISTFPFPAFKYSPWVRRHKRIVLLSIFFMIASVWWFRPFLLVFINGYVVASFVYFLIHRQQFKGIFNGPGEEDKDEDD